MTNNLTATEQIQEMYNFIEKEYQNEIIENVRKGKKVLEIDFILLSKFNPDIANGLIDEPEEIIKAIEIAIEQFDLGTNFKDIKVRIKNFHLLKEGHLLISDKRVEHLGKLWWFRGVSRVMSIVHPIVISAKFECPSCGTCINVLQLDPLFKEPTRCSCGRKGKFRLLNEEKEDIVRMVLEEDYETIEGDEQPQQINVMLRRGLTSKNIIRLLTPGKKAIITGVLKDIKKSEKQAVSNEREWLLVANHIEPIDDIEYTITISQDEEKKIIELSKNPDIYNILIDSLAPTIYGYREEKLALVLQAFRGVTKRNPYDDKIEKRGYFHIGFIGDPGEAKSSIANGLKKVLPKCRATSGKHASAVGLTWGARHDDFIKAWVIEAGAMVLANDGLVIVDEADKIEKEDLGKMNQGLEHGYFEASKMGIQTRLRAETAGLFIANPKEGRYTPFEPIYKQFDLDPTLVSRLAMIFIFQDTINPELDEAKARHIFKSHHKIKEVYQNILNPLLIKKYISYARKYCNPELNKDQEGYFATKYATLRQLGNKEGRVFITPRQLEDIIRLSEAFAKVKLSNKVTNEDIDRAFDLMLYALKKFSIDSEGNVDIDVMELGGKTYEVRSKENIFRETFKELVNKKGSKIIEMQDLINELVQKNFSEVEAEKLIEHFKFKEKEMYEPKPGRLSWL